MESLNSNPMSKDRIQDCGFELDDINVTNYDRILVKLGFRQYFTSLNEFLSQGVNGSIKYKMQRSFLAKDERKKEKCIE